MYLQAEFAVLSSSLNPCDSTDILPEAETNIMGGLTFTLQLYRGVKKKATFHVEFETLMPHVQRT